MLTVAIVSTLGYSLATHATNSGKRVNDTPTREDIAHRVASLTGDELANLLTKSLQQIANEKAHKRNLISAPRVRVTLDLDTKSAYLDLGRDFLSPRDSTISPILEQDLQDIQQRLDWQLGPNPPIHNYYFRFDGKELLDFFPEERKATEEAMRGSLESGGPVVVAAGHGRYKHFGFNDWRTQRDSANGITEDDLSPIYAAELAFWLNRRSEKTAVQPRGTKIGTHAESGVPWSDMAARYRLEELLPERSDIWNSLPGATDNLRHYKEDIRSRPLYANSVGAEGIVHLHTNAEDSGSTRGTRVYVTPGRNTDEALGKSVLCSMQELIHAIDGYADFPVAKAPNVGNHGENRLAKMPSIIVETAFHTNVEDAKALLDPVFRTASMKGVEKGYRLFSEDRKCEPFKLSEVIDDPVPLGNFIPVDAHYEGNPEFEATLVTEFVECPDDMQCWTAEIPFDKRPSPVRFFIDCGSSATPREHHMQVKIIDADNVDTGWERYTVSCPGNRDRSVPSAFNERTYVAPN
ncbi:N-acetylmuramoyl-L-alanine amidase [Pinirhizobacter soli]|uniref:N-acetylmuramoyl-L-alanine amidase n=1 Tax=Pinirhizobacter soli TaxID=2786953 RepID=UPI002029D968|nr:N-acetylmuramoyl-L-alanine amidase [Pinirhizobacter soli]